MTSGPPGTASQALLAEQIAANCSTVPRLEGKKVSQVTSPASRPSAISLASTFPITRFSVAKLVPPRGLPDFLSVDPRRVSRRVTQETKGPLTRSFLISDKVWKSIRLERVDVGGERETLRALLAGEDPERTPEFQQRQHALRRYSLTGNPRDLDDAGNCRSTEDILEYLSRLVQIFYDVQNHGYKTQTELPLEPQAKEKNLADEIRLVVSPQGEVLRLRGGTHRIVIAQELGLNSVPALIDSISESWARRHLGSRSGSLAESIGRALMSKPTPRT